jgi:hypothetical protein
LECIGCIDVKDVLAFEDARDWRAPVDDQAKPSPPPELKILHFKFSSKHTLRKLAQSHPIPSSKMATTEKKVYRASTTAPVNIAVIK